MCGETLFMLLEGVNCRLPLSAQQIHFSPVQEVGYIVQQAPIEVLLKICFRQLNTVFIDQFIGEDTILYEVAGVSVEHPNNNKNIVTKLIPIQIPK
jgi:hypothetical protein